MLFKYSVIPLPLWERALLAMLFKYRANSIAGTARSHSQRFWISTHSIVAGPM